MVVPRTAQSRASGPVIPSFVAQSGLVSMSQLSVTSAPNSAMPPSTVCSTRRCLSSCRLEAPNAARMLSSRVRSRPRMTIRLSSPASETTSRVPRMASASVVELEPSPAGDRLSAVKLGCSAACDPAGCSLRAMIRRRRVRRPLCRATCRPWERRLTARTSGDRPAPHRRGSTPRPPSAGSC